MRIVVTGSAGRVGRSIVLRLAREHDVVGIDRFPASTAVQHVGDILDRRLLDAAFAGAHAVVHVAALHAPHVGIVPDADFERVNVEGTEAVVAAARRAGSAGSSSPARRRSTDARPPPPAERPGSTRTSSRARSPSTTGPSSPRRSSSGRRPANASRFESCGCHAAFPSPPT